MIAKAVTWARRCRPPLSEAEAVKVAQSVLQIRRRSPEHAALIRARELDLSSVARLAFVALVAHQHELGRAGETFAAPQRLMAGLIGVKQQNITPIYRRLAAAGLIELLPGRDPISGRKISTVHLLP